MEKDWVIGEITACFESDFQTLTYSSLYPIITQMWPAGSPAAEWMHLQTDPSP